MKVLGIESSCDETAAAVVEDGTRLLGNAIASSVDLHTAYGGVVPEIAARSHIEVIIPTIREALDQAGCGWPDIDAIAVTKGPGLSGSLLIGVMTARSYAITQNKPLFGVNHVLGHVYSTFLTDTSLPGFTLPSEGPHFPLLALIVSGGHTQLVLFEDYFTYRLLGQTLDDAIGEAYDKVAKILGLPYPGGPSVSAAAGRGNDQAVPLPIAHLQGAYDFSFSGLKTAVLRAAQQMAGKDYAFPSFQIAPLLSESQKNDIAASFQRTAIETLVKKTVAAAQQYKPATVVLCGGVAANTSLRERLGAALDAPLLVPDFKLCTDNAAMIASLGFYTSHHQQPDDPYSLSVFPGLRM